jgi:dipeptidyl aminopeptidase/acylaminoacyl peptidase
LINGKQVKNKTNTTLNLTPDEYQVEIKKDGFTSWSKNILIEKELMVKTDAYLFPTYPDLKALTFTGAANPVMSPDGKKVVFAVDSDNENDGLWVLDLGERPLGLPRDPRQIIQSAPKGRDFAKAEGQWAPDSKQILITLVKTPATAKVKALEENFLLNASVLNPNTQLVDVTDQKESLLAEWQQEADILQKDKLNRLPEELTSLLENVVGDITFSPDETKILYTATASASIPKEMIPPLPGASSQPEQRDLEPGKIYIYDLKEDRNFALDLPEKTQIIGNWQIEQKNDNPKITWFPTSKHLFLIQKDKISIMEYDNTNHLDLYSGPFENSFAFVFPSGNRFLILTSLSKDTPPNLYAITLRQ